MVISRGWLVYPLYSEFLAILSELEQNECRSVMYAYLADAPIFDRSAWTVSVAAQRSVWEECGTRISVLWTCFELRLPGRKGDCMFFAARICLSLSLSFFSVSSWRGATRLYQTPQLTLLIDSYPKEKSAEFALLPVSTKSSDTHGRPHTVN